MSNDIIDKVLRIMELALLINPTSTVKGRTGNKPTIMIQFQGHVAGFDVLIYSDGWAEDADAQYKYMIYFDKPKEKTQRTLDAILEHLENIYRIVQEVEENDTV